MKLYAIRDQKAEFFMPVLEASNDEHAARIIADAISNGARHMAAHHDDYQVYCLADYDNKTGDIQPMLPSPVISLSEIMEKYFKKPEQTDIEEASRPPEEDT
ncbi:nonstructural protein [Microviridae sp.]|nr:nonstructural protein [Microviridae sp.]